MIDLRSLPRRLFDGIVPATVATCSADGVPNVAVLSHVYLVDRRHVALSRQFFNKTTRNIMANPRALLSLWDPVDFGVVRLRATHVRTETEGPTFDAMALRIDAIAAHTGMKGIFKLLASDVFEVADVARVTDHLGPPPASLAGPELALEPLDRPPEAREELWALQRLSQRINRATDRRRLFAEVLEGLEEDFGFEHAMVLLCRGDHLATVASRGYPDGGMGSRVALGEGLIGGAAKERRILRMSCLGTELRYGRSVRTGFVADGIAPSAPGVPLPGLPDAQSHLAIPLVVGEHLLGVLALESREASCFESWHEAFLGVVADQIAAGIERLPGDGGCDARPMRRFVFYRNDDAVFVDDEYLIRNVPGRILWRLLSCHRESGRSEFTNRELRLDPSLGLPALKDNLESRLILLRKRLEEKCPEVRLVRRGRGRFGLELDCDAHLEERESAAL